MQFFKFWTQANRSASGNVGDFDVTCYGYSNDSLEDALRVAEQRAQSTAQAMANGVPRDQGYYGNAHPIREEIIEAFEEDGLCSAIISRNHYGCLVLNTADVFFADIDKPDQSNAPSPIASILNLFGMNAPETKSFEQELIDNIAQHCSQNSNLGLRLYRTANGYRIVVTNETIPANEARSRRLLQSLGSDKLYVSLCRSQDCYRARLTPKPWRCGATRPPCRYPFSTDQQKHTYRQWEQQYESTAQAFATCALIGQFGSNQIHPTVDKITRLHDHYVLNGDRPIA